MLDRSKQIIPDAESVARFIDPETIKNLDSHCTFTVNALIEKINAPLDTLLPVERMSLIFKKVVADSTYDFLNFSEDINKTTRSFGITLSLQQLELIFKKIHSHQHYHSLDFFKEVNAAVVGKANIKSISSIFMDGASVMLLQPDGKGWQKGKLKMCLEFTPEEPDLLVPQIKPVETHSSPLDEIRQLSNELASVGSIDQN
jgi:KGK domain